MEQKTGETKTPSKLEFKINLFNAVMTYNYYLFKAEFRQ